MSEIPETFTGAAKQDAAPVSVASLRGRFARPRATVPLYLDGEAVAEAEGLEQVLVKAREYDETTNEPPTARRIEQQLVDVRQRAEASLVQFKLQALSHRAWKRMVGEHPPTEQQLADAPVNQKPDYNEDTLPGELVRAQLLSPDPGTPDEWAAFWDELSDGQVTQLWGVGLALQIRSDGSLGKSEIVSEILSSYGGS